MKKSLLLLLLPFLCGCSEKEEPIGGPVIGPTYLIARYVEGDMKLDYIPRTAATDGKSNTLYIDWADTEEYYNPDMEKYNLGRQEFWTPENKAKYLEIAKRNGDEIGAYEGGTPPGLYFGDQIALADNFTSMHITSDADWDEEHPAGNRSTTCSGYRCGVGNRGMNTGPRFFAARGWIGSGRNICR